MGVVRAWGLDECQALEESLEGARINGTEHRGDAGVGGSIADGGGPAGPARRRVCQSQIAAIVPPAVSSLLLTSKQDAASIIAQQRRCGVNVLQLWQISSALRELVDIPVFLAGGLNPENVAEAIRQVGPFGVDVCTGVRTEGRLDEAKLTRFLGQIEKLPCCDERA